MFSFVFLGVLYGETCDTYIYIYMLEYFLVRLFVSLICRSIWEAFGSHVTALWIFVASWLLLKVHF